MDSDIRVRNIETSFRSERARTPLKFGASVVEEVEYCTVKATVENGRGDIADGYGGIFLMDFWGWPDFNLSHEPKSAAMAQITEEYCDLVLSYPDAAHPIEIFYDLEADLREANDAVCAQRELLPPQTFLGALVCASPVDAALHDAFGVVNGIDTYRGYGPDFMCDLSRWLGPEFKGRYVEEFIREQYLPEIPIFHLVGGLDKLTESEVDSSDPDDGLPNSLEAWVRRDGVYCLKVKLRGNDIEWDVQRTIDVHDIGERELAALGTDELHVTADTNEQCESPEYIVEFLHRIKEQSPACYERILYIEQPTERDLTLNRHDMRPIAELKPVIVDESLTDLESFDLAMELAWSGIALKSCKCQSSDMIMAAKAKSMGIAYSVQDLTNPSLALIHSVGLGARTHTIMGVEANSRQFFPASTLPEEQRVHDGIFTVRRGRASTASLQGPGLGYQMEKMRAGG